MITLIRRRMSGETGDAGYVAVLVALMLPILIMLAAFCVDIARWYVAGELEQKAADAASLAGVPYIPQDFASAYSTAMRIAANNDFDTTKSSGGNVVVTVCTAAKAQASNGSAPDASCGAGLRPSQLRVTITNTIPNIFASIFGVNKTTISRTAVSDFNSAAPMGSPCNSFGNMPPDPSNPFALSSVPPATCGVNNGFWANIFGPDAPKRQGDEYATKVCQAGDDGCNGTTNTEYDAKGYYYLLRVQPGFSGPVTVDAYDPAEVNTGNTCGSIKAYAYATNNMNQFTTQDATTRYKNSTTTTNAATTPSYCTGDYAASTPLTSTTTKFEVLNPTASQDPTTATPVSECSTQSFGSADLSTDAATKGMLQQYNTPGVPSSGNNPAYNVAVAKVFHQWVPLCTINNAQPGDYYIHVSTTSGNGLNRYALRARASNPSMVSIAGATHMSIYANVPGGTYSNTAFNLIRVPTSAANNTIVINLFDVGDVNVNTVSNTLSVLPPLDPVSAGTVPTCTTVGPYTMSNCTISGLNSNDSQGRLETVSVRIPPTYTCQDLDPGGCWWRIAMVIPNGTQDTTTWSAQIVGDPVRLTQ